MNQNLLVFFAVLGGSILAVGGFISIIYFLRSRKKEGETNDKALLMLQEQLKEIRGTLDSKLGESTKFMQQQFGESAKIVKDVTERLVKLDETNKQVVGFADQLKSLQDVLKNPKQRGVLGEYYLETVLKNVFSPGQFQMQYKFNDGDIVDAVVFLDKGKILPVDSKFSLENYNRLVNENNPEERERLEKVFKQDLRNRIDETSKYIRPKEETMDYAFMFIPSEAIYYDLLVNRIGAVKSSTQDLVEYAFKQKHVIIVSPTTFMAYLSTVLQGLRTLQIEESAKQIKKDIERLGKHLGSYEEFMKKLGNNLGTTVNTYNSSYKELAKIDKDVLKITGEAIGTETKILEKPEQTES